MVEGLSYEATTCNRVKLRSIFEMLHSRYVLFHFSLADNHRVPSISGIFSAFCWHGFASLASDYPQCRLWYYSEMYQPRGAW